MIEIKAPNSLDLDSYTRVFLAGSIEMGEAELWQDRIVKEFINEKIIFINPRRDDWDNTWTEDNPELAKQINWELNALDCSGVVVMYFDPATKSPISLLELGLLIGGDRDIVVCCPDGFWRKTNVKVVCERNKIPLANTFEEFIILIRKELNLK